MSELNLLDPMPSPGNGVGIVLAMLQSLIRSRDDVDVRRPTQAFFALSQMNYSTPGKAHRYAQPLRETDAQLQRRMDQDMRGIK